MSAADRSAVPVRSEIVVEPLPEHAAADPAEYLSRSEADTRRLGAALATILTPGTVVALVGNLGAGKTRLVQAVAEALGVDRETVTSPTFVLLQEYAGRLPLYHFDAYRLRDIDEFLALGAEELLWSEGVCLIEWADRVAEALPGDHLRIEIEAAGPEARRFRFTGTGPRSRALVDQLHKRLVA